MAALILPNRWARQPQGPISLDRGNPLGKRILSAYFRGMTYGASTGRTSVAGGTTAFGYSADGYFSSWDAATWTTAPAGWFNDGTIPVTFAYYSRTGASVNSYNGIYSATTAASTYFLLMRGISGYNLTAGRSTGNAPAGSFTGLPDVAANTTERVVITFPSGMDSTTYTGVTAWVNRNKYTSATFAGFSGTPPSSPTFGWDSSDSKWTGLLDELVIFKGILTDAEVAEYYDNPWQIWKSPHRRLFFGVAAAGGNVNITPAQGSVVITGNAPVLATSLIPTAGSITITGYAPSIVQTTAITPGVGSVTVSGAAGLLNLGVIPTAGSVAITGYAPTVNTSGSAQITPSVGSVTIAGYEPITNLGTVVPSGSIALSGYSPSVVQSILITPGSGSISITGYAPTITGIAIVSATPSVGAGKATRDRSVKRQKFVARIDGEDFVVNSPSEAEALINQAREKAAELARVRASEIVAKRKAKANKGSLLNTKPLTIDIPQVDIRKGDRFSEAANLFRQQLQAEIDNAFSQAARDAEISLLMHLHKQLDDEAAIVALLF